MNRRDQALPRSAWLRQGAAASIRGCASQEQDQAAGHPGIDLVGAEVVHGGQPAVAGLVVDAELAAAAQRRV